MPTKKNGLKSKFEAFPDISPGTCPGLACPLALDGDLCCIRCPENPSGSFDTSRVLTLNLPFPPSVNHYWRSVRIGNATRTLISAAGRVFRRQVAAIVTAEQKALRIASDVAVAVTLHAPDNRRRDLDNFGGKALLDSLTHAGVWLDDDQVIRLTMTWGKNVRGGMAVVQIRRLD